jgi:hypothetical protein
MFESKSEFVRDNEGQCIETSTITIDGKSFTSGGSFIGKNPITGKYEGIVYGYETENKVGTWDGSFKVTAYFGKIFYANFLNNRRRFVWFTHNDIKFVGINYSVDNSDCYTVREIKS